MPPATVSRWPTGPESSAGNLEFIQFHPTTLYSPGRKPFLISEAVRGEGARLLSVTGVPFMEHTHPLKDLAPRDIVARAIDRELKESGEEYVQLNITHRDPEFVRKRFPNIYERCLQYGFDITKRSVPVVPAAHYACGGVLADILGQTSLPGLYCTGEVAMTGMHGANRLASNSLLEAVVMAEFAARESVLFRKGCDETGATPELTAVPEGKGVQTEGIFIAHNRRLLQRVMADFVGIVRTQERLRLALNRIRDIKTDVDDFYHATTAELLPGGVAQYGTGGRIGHALGYRPPRIARPALSRGDSGDERGVSSRHYHSRPDRTRRGTMARAHEMILILDFGSQYTQLIARRVREENVYCEIAPFNVDLKNYADHNVRGFILSGGPSSLADEDSPRLAAAFFDTDKPILGICYGMQLMVDRLGGRLVSSAHREYGRSQFQVTGSTALFAGMAERSQVWMSHGDSVVELPEGFAVTGSTDDLPVAAVASPERKLFGLQFHPEVHHTAEGKKLLHNFLFDVCKMRGDWTTESFIDESVAAIRQQVGDKEVILGISGGVDSSVAAMLLSKAIGGHLHAIFVNNGLLRKNEFEDVSALLGELGINLHPVDASELFLSRLAGIEDPEKKRKIIGASFIDVFEKAGREDRRC